MLSFDDALAQILAQAKPLPTEELPIGAKCLGRYLAKPVVANLTQPPFNASSMDGYAVRAQDVSKGAVFSVVGESQAGSGYDGAVHAGQSVRIFTGAPVPSGADAVIMQEEADRTGETVCFSEAVKTGQNIRLAGLDFAQGKELLGIGQVLTPASIGLTASANIARVNVHQQPKLAMLATGDELVLPGGVLQADQIIASNGFGLSALLAPYCRDILDLGIAKDDKAIHLERLQKALESDADMIITSGGASVGDHDLVQPCLQELGVDLSFWKIAMRPGKPLMFGKFGKKLIIGLPGNPVSAMLTASLLVLPALKALGGSGDPYPRVMRLPLAKALPANGPRRHFMRAHLVTLETGTHILPFEQHDSAHQSSFATAQALIIHRENATPLEAGAFVDIIPLPL